MAKKIFRACALVALAVLGFAGCSPAGSSEKISVVTTVFPLYDWAREVVGGESNRVTVTFLADNGVDLHSYQPTTSDLGKILKCDLFVHVGGVSDAWVESALKQPGGNPRRRILNLIEALGDAVKEEQTVEGMEHHEHDHGHAHAHAHAEGHHEEGHHHGEKEMDEHVWLSLRIAKTCALKLAEELASVDPEHAESYRANAKAYAQRLDALDDKYAEAVRAAPAKTLLFADRFPFRYLVDDYGLKYFAAFEGCSAETAASFKTVAFLAGKLKEHNLPAVLVIEGATHRVADSVVNASGLKVPVLAVDSLQSTTSKDAANGVTYLGAMEKNLESFRKALGTK